METREARIIGRTVELRGRRKGGEIFPLEMSLSAIDLPEGIGFLGVIRDLTERRRMQGGSIQAEKLASLGLLSAGVAHEINNPLAYVTNNLAVLERDVRGLAEVLEAYEAGPADPGVGQSRGGRANRQTHRGERPALHPGEPGAILNSTRQGVKRVSDIVQNLRGSPGSTRPPSTGWTCTRRSPAAWS